MKIRRPISPSLRFSIYERDKYACQYCGRRPPEVVLHVDHVRPVVLGGDNRIDNLLTACRDCNLGKGARDPGLAMAHRPRTPGETRAYLQWQARWWAQEALWADDPQFRLLAWEIAAKGSSDPIILRVSPFLLAQLRGLTAIGVLTVAWVGTLLCGVSIQPLRGRGFDNEIEEWLPWGLSGIDSVRHAPSVSQVH